jgi:hypothetical protein
VPCLYDPPLLLMLQDEKCSEYYIALDKLVHALVRDSTSVDDNELQQHELTTSRTVKLKLRLLATALRDKLLTMPR